MYKDSSNRNTAEEEKKNTKNTEERKKGNRGQGDLTAPFRDIHVLTNAGLLTAAVIILCWWLMAKKKRSPIQVMLILVVVALVGCFVGFFDPGLTY